MEIKLKHFIDKELNNPLILIGAGQTMHEFKYNQFRGAKMGVGTSILRLEDKFEFDYFVSANNEFPVPEIPLHLNFMNKFHNMTWFMSDTACYDGVWNKSDEFLSKNLNLPYCFFDERHFNGKSCEPRKKCCELIKKGNETNNIYDLLRNKIEMNIKFEKVNCTVAEHGLALAIFTGANPIFIQGIDLPLKQYQAHKEGTTYLGYNSIKANQILNLTNKILRKKLFFFYLKNLNFKPYVKELFYKIKVLFKSTSRFGYEDFDKSLKIFENLSLLAQKNNQKIYVLSKNSNLLKLKYFEYINPNLITKKYPNFFRN